MPRPKHPDCVIDGRTDPALMRCNHCRATEPVQLPMELNALVARTKEFEQTHAFCHLSLQVLREKLEAMASMEATNRTTALALGTRYRRLHSAILMREKQNREKRDRKP